MKKILVLSSLMLLAIFAMAVDVPANVKSAFDKKFPGATKVKWEKEKNKEFEANFLLKGKEMSANYSIDGTWLETEMEIPVSEFPVEVQKSLKANYDTYTVKEAEKIESLKKGILFEAELKKGLKTIEVLFDSQGNVIQ